MGMDSKVHGESSALPIKNRYYYVVFINPILPTQHFASGFAAFPTPLLMTVIRFCIFITPLDLDFLNKESSH